MYARRAVSVQRPGHLHNLEKRTFPQTRHTVLAWPYIRPIDRHDTLVNDGPHVDSPQIHNKKPSVESLFRRVYSILLVAHVYSHRTVGLYRFCSQLS